MLPELDRIVKRRAPAGRARLDVDARLDQDPGRSGSLGVHRRVEACAAAWRRPGFQKPRLLGDDPPQGPELTRTLFSTVDSGKSIPQELFMAVAEILALIYRLRQQRRQ